MRFGKNNVLVPKYIDIYQFWRLGGTWFTLKKKLEKQLLFIILFCAIVVLCIIAQKHIIKKIHQYGPLNTANSIEYISEKLRLH